MGKADLLLFSGEKGQAAPLANFYHRMQEVSKIQLVRRQMGRREEMPQRNNPSRVARKIAFADPHGKNEVRLINSAG